MRLFCPTLEQIIFFKKKHVKEQYKGKRHFDIDRLVIMINIYI